MASELAVVQASGSPRADVVKKHTCCASWKANVAAHGEESRLNPGQTCDPNVHFLGKTLSMPEE